MTASQEGSTLGRRLAIAASVVVVATVTTAIVITGTPSERRMVKLDERRVDDLQRLTLAIDEFMETQGQLPPDLATVAAHPGRQLALVDPVTSQAYEYAPGDSGKYRLCAVFTTDTAVTRAHPSATWDHGIGRHCFERRAPVPES